MIVASAVIAAQTRPSRKKLPTRNYMAQQLGHLQPRGPCCAVHGNREALRIDDGLPLSLAQ